MQKVMSDPTQRKELIGKVMEDPEVAAMKSDDEIGPLLERLQAEDMSAMSELMAKPEAFKKMQKVIKKFLPNGV